MNLLHADLCQLTAACSHHPTRFDPNSSHFVDIGQECPCTYFVLLWKSWFIYALYLPTKMAPIPPSSDLCRYCEQIEHHDLLCEQNY